MTILDSADGHPVLINTFTVEPDRAGEQGAKAAVRMATIGADGPTGTFTDDEGRPVPW